MIAVLGRARSSAAPVVGGGATYPNRPGAYTNSTEINFSQTITADLPGDQPISGTDWATINLEGNWTKTTDATAPQSPSNVWRGRCAAGVYDDGHGIGNVFTGVMAGTNRLYISVRVYFEFDAGHWHPVSNKFVNLFCNNSTILVQANESGNWRHAAELGPPNFYVDDGVDGPGEDHIPGQIDNRAVPNAQWVQVEVLIDLPGHVFKIWQDGVLTTNATPTFVSTQIDEFGIFGHRGGGGETLDTDIFYRYDHFFLAW